MKAAQGCYYSENVDHTLNRGICLMHCTDDPSAIGTSKRGNKRGLILFMSSVQ